MDLSLIWKAVLIIIIGILLIRFSGRRSISQMTISETVIMISLGTLLIQPIANKNVWYTFGLGAILIITLMAIEFIQMKWDLSEKFFTGRSKIVIENGKLNEKNLMKMRLSVDKLEMRLRQNGIENLSDLQWATIEPSGNLGYSLVKKKKFATKGDIERIEKKLESLLIHANQSIKPMEEKESNSNMFSEIKHDHTQHEGDHLQ